MPTALQQDRQAQARDALERLKAEKPDILTLQVQKQTDVLAVHRFGFTIQQITIPFDPTKPDSSRQMREELSRLLKRTRSWQELKGKSVLAFDMDVADNSQRVLPLDGVMHRFGFFRTHDRPDAWNPRAWLTLRLPQDIHRCAPLEVKSVLEEVAAQQDLHQHGGASAGVSR